VQILVVEDESVTRELLKRLLTASGHEVTEAADGAEGWKMLQSIRIPVVISDWEMPEMEGLELCRKIRARSGEDYVYFIMLTARSGRAEYLEAMDGGVDDFLTKPLDAVDLQCRLRVAERILGLRKEVKQLEGLLPICSYCKRIRDDADRWSSLETFIEKRSEAEFSHGICPDCYRKHVEPSLKTLE
jgi:sigma-B regulation protein RsbU (phosphoserine phosphatase)